METALSHDIKTHKAIIGKGENIMLVYLTKEEAETIILDNTHKKTHTVIDGNLVYVKDIQIRKIDEVDLRNFGDKTMYYTTDFIIGKHKITGKGVWEFTKYREHLKRKSEGESIQEKLDVYYGYYEDGKLYKVDKSEINSSTSNVSY